MNQLVSEFEKLKKFYNNNEFDKILNNDFGIYFLKLRSLSRTPILRELADGLNISHQNIRGKGDELFKFIFSKNIDEKYLDKFILKKYDNERNNRIGDENELYSQLYKLKTFGWGGFHQNSVERNIVNNYVKKIKNYDQLCLSIENDINPRLKEYVLASWYNNWTSILIEDMFNQHEDIIPAVGQIKKIDFFWNNFPFDLKVTYFPDGFIQQKRKEKGLKKEVTILKKFARDNDIYYDRNDKDSEIFSELFNKISEDPSQSAKNFIKEFKNTRTEIINESLKNPKELIIWLYENQGTRRFDASNRLFIILIDKENMDDSWKLKRNKKILTQAIDNFLNMHKKIDFKKLKIMFNWESKQYNTYATSLYIFK
ncbi:MAG: hypothetical protein LBM96_07385 [Methanobrevibacter sp.]|nr:hypothetical protein [Candidatus Methanoflexus mossambicus]